MEIDLLIVLFGICIGFFITYLTAPEPRVVIKYPTIDNIQSTTYVDENGQCYKYFAEEVRCGSRAGQDSDQTAVPTADQTSNQN